MPRVKKLMKGRAKSAGGAGGDDEAGSGVDPAEAARLEYDAYLKAEQERKLREAALRRTLKERMDTQRKLDAVNRSKVDENWRRILRQVKLDELRSEIDVVAQMHEREVDRRDALIAMLDTELESAEEQYQMALRAHLQTVEELVELHRNRLQALQTEFDTAVETLDTEFSSERAAVTTVHNRDRAELMAVMSEMEATFAKREHEANSEFQNLRDEIKGKNSDEYNMLRMHLEAQIEELERHFENAHTQYMRTNEQRQESFKMMMMKDEDINRTIRDQSRRIQKLQNNLSFWKAKLHNSTRDNDQRTGALQLEKTNVQRHFRELKAQLQRFRDTQMKRVTFLTVSNDECMKELREKQETAERILRLVEMCRKLETERERIMPSVDLAAMSELDQLSESAQVQQLRAANEPELLRETAGEQLPYHPQTCLPDGTPAPLRTALDNLYRRFNKAHLDTMALEREYENLQQENTELRAILKQYLDGITVNDDVLRSDNPLLVVNHRSNTLAQTASIGPAAAAAAAAAASGAQAMDRPRPVVIEARSVVQAARAHAR